MSTGAPPPSANGGGGIGDGLNTLLAAAEQAARTPVVEPAPDPKVSAAFALGWQMAELYRPDGAAGPAPAAHGDLPGINRLTADERAQLALQQVSAALTKLTATVTAAGLKLPDAAALSACFSEATTPAQRQQNVLALHVSLLATLTATDFRLGKAYGLGRALADTCRNPASLATLETEFRTHRINKLRNWLDDLASALPPHAGHGVGQSLARWAAALDPAASPALSADDKLGALQALKRQGELWQSLLSGEKLGPDMLTVPNYVDAASKLFRSNGRIVRRFALRYWYVLAASLLLLGLGITLLLTSSSSGSIVAGAGSIVASLGITWKSAGSALGSLGAKVEEHLWGAELDTAIADAITLLPTTSRLPLKRTDLTGGRLERAGTTLRALNDQALPRPQLLAGALDPDQLLAKIDDAEAQRQKQAAALAKLPAELRLPADHFTALRAAIQAERDEPHRVLSAKTPSPPGGPPAPPPVIYMSRKPIVSQFASVITHCLEAQPGVDRELHLGALSRLWHDVERWAEELHSRFRAFGPCDIRFLEPKLAQVLAGFIGRHPFSTRPAEVAIGDRARVIVFGDWATGLPQARNVAARIREQLQQVPDGVDCHVIHLGDTYYACLDDEARRRFLDLWPVPPSSPVGSWTLAGNHDMYAGGHGYFDVLLADPRFRAQNRCSYFSLRNEHWQILGLDSAYQDPDVAELQAPQPQWLADQMAGAGDRGTVLLTHHQPFSAYEEVDTPLAGTVAAALGGRLLEAWLWGHEHRCTTYAGNVVSDVKNAYANNARYAAVVGHGGMPNLLADQQAGTNQDTIRWEFADYYELGDDHWGLGGFAVLSFDGPQLEIQYYDEYGKERRTGAPLGYRSEAAEIAQVMAARDDRPVCPPDRLTPGADPVYGGWTAEPPAAGPPPAAPPPAEPPAAERPAAGRPPAAPPSVEPPPAEPAPA